jgi:hypothetical protein
MQLSSEQVRWFGINFYKEFIYPLLKIFCLGCFYDRGIFVKDTQSRLFVSKFLCLEQNTENLFIVFFYEIK